MNNHVILVEFQNGNPVKMQYFESKFTKSIGDTMRIGNTTMQVVIVGDSEDEVIAIARKTINLKEKQVFKHSIVTAEPKEWEARTRKANIQIFV